MNKEEFVKALESGKIIIRSQYNSRKGKWVIVKATWGKYSHGWTRHIGWYDTDDLARKAIDKLCENHPELYVNAKKE